MKGVEWGEKWGAMVGLRMGRIVGYKGEVVGRRTDCGSYTGDTETVRQ